MVHGWTRTRQICSILEINLLIEGIMWATSTLYVLLNVFILQPLMFLLFGVVGSEIQSSAIS